MISILFATGFEQLDNTLEKFFSKDEKILFIKQKVYFREGLGDSITRNHPDIILLSDKLEGNTLSLEQLIRITRKRHPDTRIIFILTDKDNYRIKKLLYQLSVFDIFSLEPKLDTKELYQSFLKPKEWKDVAHQMTDLDSDSFELDTDFLLEDKDEGIILEDDYSKFETKFKHNPTVDYFKTAAFWSVRQQSGSTFLSVNTALLLSQNSEQKILLVDFNPNNPNIHVQFKLNDPDGNHNLGALCEDLEGKTISNILDVEDYLITHPYYPNLKIMLGVILKSKKPNQKTLYHSFKLIKEYAEQEGYTSVIFDMESGMEEEHIINVIKEIDVSIMPITETPGNIVALQKLFDHEFGPFFLNFLDLKKVYPIINKSSNTDNTKKIQHLIQSFLNRKIEVFVPSDQEIYASVQNGSPLLKKECSPELLRPLSMTANYIHNIFAIQPLDERKKNNKKRFGLF